MKQFTKTVAAILSVVLLVLYIISLTFNAVSTWGILGFFAATLFFIPITLYQMVTHLLVGDFMESVVIILWLGATYGLYLYSKK